MIRTCTHSFGYDEEFGTGIKYYVNFAFDDEPDIYLLAEDALVWETAMYPHRRSQPTWAELNGDILLDACQPTRTIWWMNLQQVADLIELFSYTGHSPDLVAYLTDILSGRQYSTYNKETLLPHRESLTLPPGQPQLSLTPWFDPLPERWFVKEGYEDLSLNQDYDDDLANDLSAFTEFEEMSEIRAEDVSETTDNEWDIPFLLGDDAFTLDPTTAIPEPDAYETQVVFEWRTDEKSLIHSAFQSIAEMRRKPEAVAKRNARVPPDGRNPLIWAARHEVSYEGYTPWRCSPQRYLKSCR